MYMYFNMWMITSVFPLLYSSFDGDVNDLDLGDEVEYTVTRKSAKLSAENIRKVPKGTVAPEVSARISSDQIKYWF